MMKSMYIAAAVAAIGINTHMSMAALASTPIYQWTFDGGSGTPGTSGGAGGGVLTTGGNTGAGTTPANIVPVLTGTGVTGNAGDNAYFNGANVYNTGDTSAANSTALTGASAPSVVNQITVTAWIDLPNGDINSGLGKILFVNSSGQQYGNPIAFSLNTSAQVSANEAPTAGAGARLQANVANVNANSVTTLNGTTYQGNISAGQVDTAGSATSKGWHFVAFTYDGTATNATGNLNFYTAAGLGGTVSNIGTGYLAATIPDFTGATVAVGNNGGTLSAGSGRPIDGSVDDIRIYSGIASLADLQNIAINADVNAVPEPATLGLLSLGGLTLARRRRSKN